MCVSGVKAPDNPVDNGKTRGEYVSYPQLLKVIHSKTLGVSPGQKVSFVPTWTLSTLSPPPSTTTTFIYLLNV
jgi:hypothetical protein